MRIGIDARLYGQTGVGRYIRNLISALAREDKANQYYIFLLAGDFAKFSLPGKNWHKIKADIPWHSLSEQVKMPQILYRQKLDLVHFPYFNVPLLYFKPFVCTLHDLTIWSEATGKASTRPLWYFYIKKIGYILELFYIAKKSKKIITISEAVKKDIVKILNVASARVKVIYEGVDRSLLGKSEKMNIKRPYILLVGNFYPHKNLTRAIFAWRKLITDKRYKNYCLFFVGPKDFFYFRLKDYLKEHNLLGKVQFFLNPNDKKLAYLYSEAEMFLFPSLAEGFGLPGLEAMALHCPVVCSDLPVFREIYQDAAIYFNPRKVESITKSIKKVIDMDKKERRILIEKGLVLEERYSWQKCARESKKIYESL